MDQKSCLQLSHCLGYVTIYNHGQNSWNTYLFLSIFKFINGTLPFLPPSTPSLLMFSTKNHSSSKQCRASNPLQGSIKNYSLSPEFVSFFVKTHFSRLLKSHVFQGTQPFAYMMYPMLKGLQCIVGQIQTRSAICKFTEVNLEYFTAKQMNGLEQCYFFSFFECFRSK